MLKIAACLFLLIFSGPNSLAAPQYRCGTLQFYERLHGRDKKPDALQSSPVLARTAATRQSGRTFETAHFLIHYCLHGVHKARTGPEDDALIKTFDSVYFQLSLSLQEPELSQKTYEKLDDLDAAHPVFIQKQGEYFEMARQYYVGSLGMQEPLNKGRSAIFNKPPKNGKFHIEIVNIADADEDWLGIEIYALTYPPDFWGGQIIMDNDFLYKVNRNRLDTLKSIYNGIKPGLVNNYALEWEKGIKVTAVHEYYHAVQYTYTPNPDRFHFWYELSATGMEERLATDVNDYLQYLPALFRKHNTFSINNDCYNCTETYGSSIFHTFLTENLGIDFDAAVWQLLKNDNKIEKALKSIFIGRQTSLAELFPDFTQPLLYAQKPAEENPFTTFSDDLLLWPVIQPKVISLDKPSGLDFILPSMTFEVLTLEGGPGAFRKQATVFHGSGLTITSLCDNVPAIRKITLDTSFFLLDNPALSCTEMKVLFSNGSWSNNAEVKIASFAVVKDTVIAPFPNPYLLEGDIHNLIFTKPDKVDSVTQVSIFSEYGLPVINLLFEKASDNWIWNLQNDRGELIPMGIYYFKAGQQPLRPLLVLNDRAE